MLLKNSFELGIGNEITKFFNNGETYELSFITHWCLLLYWGLMKRNEFKEDR